MGRKTRKQPDEYSLMEAAAMIGVSHRTLLVWAKRGRIATRKHGMLPGSPRYISKGEVTRIMREMRKTEKTA